ncbi:MAG: FAD-dependent thymidylate synthase [Bryobacteraceae bacterium]
MPPDGKRRVFTVAPMPPEKCAYALARYSRSPDSIRESIEWVRTHDEKSFLESFYFQYGHASIADLGHLVICLEGISELAATEVEDETLWDGQAKSSRYQDFSKSGVVTPPELSGEAAALYQASARELLDAYRRVHELALDCLRETLPKPEEMKPEAYRRNLTARAFDVARYLLFWGIPTNIGQVTSIRTLERQIRRLKASPYQELRDLGHEIAEACASTPDCVWSPDSASEPIAPTLAKFVDVDQHLVDARRDLAQWAAENLPAPAGARLPDVDLLHPTDTGADIVATLLYEAADRPYRELYEMASAWSGTRRAEVIDLALRSRTRRDELLPHFRGGPYVFDIVMDIGAYRDLHRHRRCHQFRQAYSGQLGFAEPALVAEAGAAGIYRAALDAASAAYRKFPAPANRYLLPFATRARFLFKMDFAEAEYICRLRSGVKGHFSYRKVAWEMKEAMERLEPELGRLIQATPPSVVDPLRR